MIKINTTQRMVAAFGEAVPPVQVSVRPGLEAALEAMAPEAKRELAAQLLRSANESEGHSEGAPNEDATDGGTLLGAPVTRQDNGTIMVENIAHNGHYGVSDRCDAEADIPGYTCKLPKGHEGRHALGNGWQFDAPQHKGHFDAVRPSGADQ